MGTSGNRKGFKVFSINTTIRNPLRNIEFLEYFRKFNGLVFDKKVKRLYLIELIRNGVYKFNIMSESTKQKLLNDEELSDLEIEELLKNNPQKTGFEGRVMTQLRALKDQGLLSFDGSNINPKIYMTRLALMYINKEILLNDLYLKLMIGLHSKNPARDTLYNESRVFLNTLFVIDGVKKIWAKISKKEAKGLLKYEFAFILGMKDCNYKKCIVEILKYRKKFGLKENKKYIQDYLFEKEKLIKISYKSIIDYADEVFRKFELTGFLIKRGKSTNIYYDFSTYNNKKIDIVLKKYKNYKFETFKNIDSYNDFIYKLELPWEKDENIKKDIVIDKAKQLGIDESSLDFTNLSDLENSLNTKFYKDKFSEILKDVNLVELLDELKYLSDNDDEKSIYDILPQPLRLEYVLTLIFAKKFGNLERLESNLIYNENGLPISFAPAGKIDLIYDNVLIEATMIKNRNQQLNSETTSIARHMYEKKKEENKEFRTILVAPYIHFDAALFFKFCAKEFECRIAPITINNFINIIKKSDNMDEFGKNFDSFNQNLLNKKTDIYIDEINKI